jgi:hypothetical protein
MINTALTHPPKFCDINTLRLYELINTALSHPPKFCDINTLRLNELF